MRFQEEQLIMVFDDEVEPVPTYRLPLSSVKRFYTLLEAHGVFVRSLSDGHALLYQALSTPGTIALERQDTRDEITRLSNSSGVTSQIQVKRLEKHLLALEDLLSHVIQYSTVKSTFVLR
jgi:hypothetical protein